MISAFGAVLSKELKKTMTIQICNKRLQELIKLVQLQEGFMLFLCTLNFVFCIVAILGNLLVIFALWKALSIPDSLKRLFLSLAVSDLAVGLFVQPMHGAIIAVISHMEESGNSNFDFFCPTIVTIYLSSAYLFSVASFLSVVVVAVDRLLAVSLHLRYNEFVTTKRVEVIVGMLWLTSLLVTLVYVSLPNYNDIVGVVLEVVGLLMTSAAYFQIYKIARYHQNKIHSQCQVGNDVETLNKARVKRSAYNTFYVYAVFVVCYIPNVFCGILLNAFKLSMPFIIAFYITIFLIYINSSLNILVYCWRYREIREIVKATLKKICNRIISNE